MKQLNLKFEVNCSCGHRIATTGTKRDAAVLVKVIYEKQNGLCEKCYTSECNDRNIAPWWR